MPTGLVVSQQDEKPAQEQGQGDEVLRLRLYDAERERSEDARAATARARSAPATAPSGSAPTISRRTASPTTASSSPSTTSPRCSKAAVDELLEALIAADEAARLAELPPPSHRPTPRWSRGGGGAGGGGRPQPALRGTAAARGCQRLPSPPPSCWPEAAPQPLPAAHALPPFDELKSPRRAAREPMAYVLGRARVLSLEFVVGPGVLVPRSDSETLIEAAVAPRSRTPQAPSCACSISASAPAACCSHCCICFQVPTASARTLSGQALACARLNAERLGVPPPSGSRLERTSVGRGCGRPVRPRGQQPTLHFPRTAEIAGLQPEVARFEPWAALDGGRDGLDAYRLIAAAAAEIGHRRAAISWSRSGKGKPLK